jgi:hypothetical protein
MSVYAFAVATHYDFFLAHFFAVTALGPSLSLSLSYSVFDFLQFLLLGASKTRIFDHFYGTRKAP